MPVSWPRSSIGSELVRTEDGDETIQSPVLAGTLPNAKRPPPEMIKMYNPATGEEKEVKRDYVRDMERLNGWARCSVRDAQAAKEPDAEDAIPAEVAENTETSSANEADKEPANELDNLRDDYKSLTDKDAPAQWGKKKLQEEIGAALEAQTSDEPPVAEVDAETQESGTDSDTE